MKPNGGDTREERVQGYLEAQGLVDTISFKKRKAGTGLNGSFVRDYRLLASSESADPRLVSLARLLAALEIAVMNGEDMWLRIGPSQGKDSMSVNVKSGRATTGRTEATNLGDLCANLDTL